MEAIIQKGRLLILTIIATLIVTSLLSTTLTFLTFGPDRLWRDGVRLLLTTLLCFLLYQGRTWTRWLLATLVGLGGLLGLLGALAVLTLNATGSIFLFGIAIAYLACTGVLCFSTSVTAFLTHQQSKHHQSVKAP